MHFTLRDPNVSETMNGFMVLANVINLVYNIPQVVQTYRTKSTGDFSPWFLSMRIAGNVVWIAYAIEVDSLLMLINTLVTVSSSVFISYYKFWPKKAEAPASLRVSYAVGAAIEDGVIIEDNIVVIEDSEESVLINLN